MRNSFGFAMSTLQNYSTKTILFLERTKFWFNINRSEKMTPANISATDSKGSFYYLQITKWMEFLFTYKHSLRNSDVEFFRNLKQWIINLSICKQKWWILQEGVGIKFDSGVLW